ncbi:MAG: hypothetical protein LBG04_00020 [Holosporaceae bacterium]|jgi:hypothetical protein|nr:hypothetical protein [Holosporaceae bacterium]
MKLLMSVVVGIVASSIIFNVKAREYVIWNEASDSFSVKIVVNDPRVVITPLTPPVCRGITIDPDKISGRTEWPCGKGGVPRKKQYDVVFEPGYVPPKGNEPFISFINEKGGFRLVFFDENYAELRSDMASERHDDPQRREYDRNHPYIRGKSYRRENEYDGFVRHWVVFDPYLVVFCYETYLFPLREVLISNMIADTSILQTIPETEYSYRWQDLPLKSQLQSKRHWWSRLCCYTD